MEQRRFECTREVPLFLIRWRSLRVGRKIRRFSLAGFYANTLRNRMKIGRGSISCEEGSLYSKPSESVFKMKRVFARVVSGVELHHPVSSVDVVGSDQGNGLQLQYIVGNGQAPCHF